LHRSVRAEQLVRAPCCYLRGDIEATERLDFGDRVEWRIEIPQKETGHCHIAVMPPGIALSEYRLFKDDHPLGPADEVHDDIRQHGGGRYSLWGCRVFFSASDNSDARYNGRSYALRRAN